MYPKMMNLQMFVLCFAIVLQCVEETFNFLEVQYPHKSVDYKNVKTQIISDMYENNPKIDRNLIDFIIEQDISICVKSFSDDFQALEYLSEYINLVDLEINN